MITLDQIQEISRKYRISNYVIAREYLQLLFLKELYSEKFAKQVYFKGGTAIRLVYGGQRFSEDLDFTIGLSAQDFDKYMQQFFKRLEGLYPVTFKERETITGRTFLMTADMPDMPQKVFIRLDFSLREDVLRPESKIIDTREYPLIIDSFVWTIGKDEVFAEKIRAFMTREKYRDLYDLWMLWELGARLDLNLVSQKLDYYAESFDVEEFEQRLEQVKEENFCRDLQPFVPQDQRERLPELLQLIKQYLRERVGNQQGNYRNGSTNSPQVRETKEIKR